MSIRKKVISLFLMIPLCLSLPGCKMPNLSNKGTDSSSNTEISTVAYRKVDTQEQICDLLLDTMQNNNSKCYFFVSSKDLINADTWLNKFIGIENIHCEYKRIVDGYNVVVTLNYWDNYSIVNAYKTGNTAALTDKQLVLYHKYCDILKTYTSKTSSDWENELAIHDYLVTNTRYELGDEAIYNAYDTLINGTAVCNGYAECFKTFMDMLGMECIAISGSANGELHIWNLVNIENEWYQVDVTWDDPINNGDGHILHTYFNITDTDMSKDHTWDTSLYPPAKGSKLSYANIKSLKTIYNQTELYQYLSDMLNKKVEYLEFTTTSTLELKPVIEKCGINVTYSYHTINYDKYSLYKIEFVY